jgi:hypothetical protein
MILIVLNFADDFCIGVQVDFEEEIRHRKAL